MVNGTDGVTGNMPEDALAVTLHRLEEMEEAMDSQKRLWVLRAASLHEEVRRQTERAEEAEKVIEVFRTWRRTPLDVKNSTAPWMKAESDAKRALREYDKAHGIEVDYAW